MRRSALSLLLVSACAPSGDGRGEAPPNLLLVSLDSTRADHVSAYGHRAPHAPDATSTPALDRLASEGVLFEHALATTSWTLPSHAALFSGAPDLVHAVELDEQALPAGLPTLAERLARAGYRTAGLHSGPYLDRRYGFARGFERYLACYGDELTRAAAAARAARERVVELERSGAPYEALVPAYQLAGEAQRALEVASQRDVSSPNVLAAARAELARMADDERPFFLFVHLFDPHYDYVPPPPFDRRFDPSYDGAIDGRDFFRNPLVSTFETGAGGAPGDRRRVVSDRDLEHLRALYTGDLAASDAAIGVLLDDLDALGVADETLVVAVADHGDEFFEHGGIGHRRTLYEEVLRVPLILRLPGRLPAGARSATPVSVADVAPTALALLGLDAGEVGGFSLLPVLDGAARPAGVLSRLTTQRRAPVAVEVLGTTREVVVDVLEVRESFRLGDRKLLRTRSWSVPPSDLAPAVATRLTERSARERAAEQLSWIDLAEHPDEPLDAFSDAFDDPDARTLLEAFRARYAELEARRFAPQATEQQLAGDLAAALRALGY